MIEKNDILKYCEEVLNENQFVVDITIANDGNIIIYVEDFNGITINDCKKISKYVEDKLNENVEDFSLEVSSPGLTNPFKVFKQYIKNIGKELEIVLVDGKKITGKLLEVNDDSIKIETKEIKKNNNKKMEIIEEENIYFDNIKFTKNIISFK